MASCIKNWLAGSMPKGAPRFTTGPLHVANYLVRCQKSSWTQLISPLSKRTCFTASSSYSLSSPPPFKSWEHWQMEEIILACLEHFLYRVNFSPTQLIFMSPIDTAQLCHCTFLSTPWKFDHCNSDDGIFTAYQPIIMTFIFVVVKIQITSFFCPT